MSTQTRTHHTYSIEIDGHTFSMPFNDESGTIDDTATLYLSKDGTRALITALCQDDSPEDPFEGDEGEFYQFDRSCIHDTSRPEPDEFKRIIRQNPGCVFTVSYCSSNHGPGTTSCSVDEGPFIVADTKKGYQGHDYSRSDRAIDNADGYYIVPDDVPADRRRSYADAILQSYEQWCNGEVYGLIRWTYTREQLHVDGQPIDEFTEWEEADRDEVWGYIGTEYAKQALADELQYYLDQLDPPTASATP